MFCITNAVDAACLFNPIKKKYINVSQHTLRSLSIGRIISSMYFENVVNT